MAALLGVRSFWPSLTVLFAGFAASVIGLEVYRGVRTGVRRGAGPLRALLRLVAGNRRRYGGYVVHAGVLVLAVAVAVSWNYKDEREVTLAPGESVELGGYTVRLDEVRGDEQPHRFSVVGSFSLTRAGEAVGALEPRLNYYPTQQQPIPTPSVRSSAVEDVFLSLMAFERDGSSATVKIVVTPMVVWLWIGAYVMALGTLVAVWPGGGGPLRRGARASDGRASDRPEPAESGSGPVPPGLVAASAGGGAVPPGRRQRSRARDPDSREVGR